MILWVSDEGGVVRATPDQEIVDSIPAPAARSLLIGSVSV